MNNKNRSLLSMLVLVALGVPLAASASPVSFDFTGTTSSPGTGMFSTVAPGTPVSGTITIDYANAIPDQSQGTVGTSTFGAPTTVWTAVSNGGSDLSLPSPVGLVFSETVTVGTYTYQTGSINAFHDESGISGYHGILTASEAVLTSSSPTIGSQSLFQLSPGVQDAYDSNGFPDFAHASGGYGLFAVATTDPSTSGTLQYGFTSVTAVPLPAAGWLLFGALSLLAPRVRRRSV